MGKSQSLIKNFFKAVPDRNSHYPIPFFGSITRKRLLTEVSDFCVLWGMGNGDATSRFKYRSGKLLH